MNNNENIKKQYEYLLEQLKNRVINDDIAEEAWKWMLSINKILNEYPWNSIQSILEEKNSFKFNELLERPIENPINQEYIEEWILLIKEIYRSYHTVIQDQQ